MESTATLGSRIRERREAKGWLQRDLAQAVEKDGSYVSALENDYIVSPGVDTLEKFARALDCTPNDLLGFTAPAESA